MPQPGLAKPFLNLLRLKIVLLRVPRQVELVAAGYLEELQARIDWSMQHRSLIDP